VKAQLLDGAAPGAPRREGRKKILTPTAGAPAETRESFCSVRAVGVPFILCFVVGVGACGGSEDPTGGSAGGRGGTPSAGHGGVSNGEGGSSASGGKGGSSASGGKGGSSASGGKGGSGEAGGKGGSSTSGGKGGNDSGGLGSIAGSASPGGEAGESNRGGATSTGGSAGAGDAGGASGDGGTDTRTSVSFNVDATASGHAISPLIYGINPGSVACSNAATHFGLCRLGGDRWSTYNWENNASNAGAPLCFQNDGALGASDDPAQAVTTLVSEAAGNGAAALVTLPILDYVAADKLGGTPPDDCSGDVRKSGTDLEYLDTRFKANFLAKGEPFGSPPDTSDDRVYQDEFVEFVKAAAGNAEVLFALDNQPGLWGVTQEAVHLAAPTYAEVVARNVAYAKMLRDHWPAAEIAGYVGYGWLDFVSLQNSAEATSEGLFVDYYLAGLAEASATDARRLIDYLDVHWFPDVYVDGRRIIENDASPELAASRVQAPRSLWDASYVEDSWIAHDWLGNQPIRLVPWLKERIAANYPGTKLAISEWNYGGGTDVSGAVAAADALGIFGREDVGLAAWKSQANDDPFVLGAFRMFRNYDGAGAAFGNTSIPASSSEVDLASVYASTDTNVPGRIVIVAINRSERVLDAALSLTSTTAFTSAATYVLTSSAPVPSAGVQLSTTTPNAFTYAMPAYSVSVIVPAP
jgi:hypothetical protein